MARARNIKPGVFKNEILLEMPPFARLLFIGLWTLADREGRIEDRPKRIKLEILPLDDVDVDALLNDLQSAGFVTRYEAAGVKVVQVNKFLKHQNPHGTEKDSELPAPDGSMTVHERDGNGYVNGTKRANNVKSEKNNVSRTLTHCALTVNPLLDNALNPESLNPESLIPESKTSARASRKGEFLEDFEIVWGLYPKRPGASKADALKAYTARRKEGITAEEIAEGVKRYAKYCAAEISEPKFIKQPETFFGPGRHFESDWNSALNNSQPVIEEKAESAQTKIQFKWHDGKIRESTYQEIDDELERMGRARRWPQFTDPNYKAPV